MGRGSNTRKADDPELRAEVEALLRAGNPVNRAELAVKYGVGVFTVRTVRAEVQEQLDREGQASGPQQEAEEPSPFDGGRTVSRFDGRRLFEVRRRKLMLQDELADLAGVSRGEIGHLERCQRKPTLRTLRKLARALGVDARVMLSPSEAPELDENLMLAPREDDDASEADFPAAANDG